jgi:hypothetical protein
VRKIEAQYGKANRIWVMDRGIPTEEVLAEMRAADPPVSYPRPRGGRASWRNRRAAARSSSAKTVTRSPSDALDETGPRWRLAPSVIPSMPRAEGRRTMACAITSLFLMAMFGIIAAGVAFLPSTVEKPSVRRQETPVAPSGDHVIA